MVTGNQHIHIRKFCLPQKHPLTKAGTVTGNQYITFRTVIVTAAVYRGFNSELLLR